MSQESKSQEGALSPYRVLDLTEGGSTLAAKILGDMGADVVKVEPPGGSPTRNMGPFYQGVPDPERSLFWFACNLNKRSITLDITKADGQALLKRLVATADFLFDSFEPGYLGGLGLGYEELSQLNPGLIMVSITPFGQTGPYAHYRGPDIVPWAMSGYMWMCGDPDRAPVRPSVPPQGYFHAAAMSAAASLIALYHRATTGQGQHVDQSVQASGPWMLTHTYQFYEYEGRILKREGTWRQFGPALSRTVYPCKDGYMVGMLAGGVLGSRAQPKLVQWMDSEGMAPDWLRDFDWANYDARRASQEQISSIADAFIAFFKTKTRQELLEAAVREGFFLAPVSTVKDLIDNRHLNARDFWVQVDHPELETSLTYPGAPFIATETPWRVYRRPPRIGEHNQEVYLDEIGLSRRELEMLVGAGVI